MGTASGADGVSVSGGESGGERSDGEGCSGVGNGAEGGGRVGGGGEGALARMIETVGTSNDSTVTPRATEAAEESLKLRELAAASASASVPPLLCS